MSFYEKTILSCYNALPSYIEQIENVIKSRARNSFRNFSPAYEQAEKILQLIEVRNDLFELMSLTEEAVKKLGEYDAMLIKYKYFAILPEIEFDHTSRSYFRRQNKALERFKINLSSVGVTEEWFEQKFLKLAFIKQTHKKVIAENGKKHTA